MSMYMIKGDAKINGEVRVSGSKNSALPIIAACILNAGTTTLYNVPNIKDTNGMFNILKDLGCIINKKGKKIVIDSSKINKFQIDEKLMNELVDIEKAVSPQEILLLVDAMAGQEAVNVAKAFNEKLHLTGMVMSKLDGDSRGGAALSIKHLTGVPIKYIGVGETIDDLQKFDADAFVNALFDIDEKDLHTEE